MGRLLCLLGRHSWGPFKSDEAGPVSDVHEVRQVLEVPPNRP